MAASAYCVKADVLLGWADISEAEAGTNRITDVIAKASQIINHKVGNRYTVPISTTDEDALAWLKGVAVSIAVYYLKYYKNPSLITKQDKEDIAIAMDMLEDIKNGKAVIPGLTQKQRVESTTEDYEPVFQEDGIANAQVDEDLIEDIEDRRD